MIRAVHKRLWTRGRGRRAKPPPQRRDIGPAADSGVFIPQDVLLTTRGVTATMRDICRTATPSEVVGKLIAAEHRPRSRFWSGHHTITTSDIGYLEPFLGKEFFVLLSDHPALLRPFGIQSLSRTSIMFPTPFELNAILDWHGDRGPKVRFVTWPGMGEISRAAYAACLLYQRAPMAQTGNEMFHDRLVHLFAALYFPQRGYDLIQRRLRILYWAQCVSRSTFDWGPEILHTTCMFDQMTAVNSPTMFSAYVYYRLQDITADVAFKLVRQSGYLVHIGSMIDGFDIDVNRHRIVGNLRVQQGRKVSRIDSRIADLLDTTYVSRTGIRELQQTYLENAYRYSLLPEP